MTDLGYCDCPVPDLDPDDPEGYCMRCRRFLEETDE